MRETLVIAEDRARLSGPRIGDDEIALAGAVQHDAGGVDLLEGGEDLADDAERTAEGEGAVSRAPTTRLGLLEVRAHGLEKRMFAGLEFSF